MPIQLGKQTRRRFVGTALGAAAGLLSDPLHAARKQGAWALLSDPHIHSDLGKVRHGAVVAENFQQVIDAVCRLGAGRDGVVINGDCAHIFGFKEDYEVFANLLEPLARDQRSGVIHLLMGNHDDREVFASVLSDHCERRSLALEGRIAEAVSAEEVNWIFLDSLREGRWAGGEIGPEQLQWLTATLDASSDKPAVVVVHHHPGRLGRGEVVGRVLGSLIDGRSLLEILRPRRQVKAIIFGHTHRWDVSRDDSGLHFVNLPPVGYVYRKEDPIGWVSAEVDPGGMTIQLHAIDPAHPAHGARHRLVWRA